MAFSRPAPTPRAAPEPIAELGPSEEPLIVSVSRHDPRKGIDVLLRALARLKANGVGFRACLVGEGRLLGIHRALATSLGLADCVAIPGRVEDVLPYLQLADVFVLPSREEGSGSVALLEALQTGVAIVSSRCDGIPEDVVDGQDALLVTPGDDLQLADALTRLLADPRLRGTLADGARRLYQDRFASDVFVAALRDTYAELGVRP
jgi:glycosyltransferase involved in cell wall biosynthesis